MPAPRTILARQVERLRRRGPVPYVGTELESTAFDNSYRDAWAAGYRGLTPASDYNMDYAMLASTRMEPLLRDIGNGMAGAGMYCEGVKASRRSTRTVPRRSPTGTASRSAS